MAKKALKKGAKLMCIPCGRQVIIDAWGAATRTIWCCGRPMERKSAKAKAKTKIKAKAIPRKKAKK